MVVRIAAIQASPAAWSASPAAMIGRPPILSERRPAIGAMKIGIAVQGRIRSPDCSGEAPCTVWKYWASRKIEPNIPTNMNSEATLAAVKVRLRKKRIGSIGAAARSSQRTNSATRAAPARRAETTSTDVQPASLPRTRPHTIASRPAAERARPGRSSRLFEPCVSSSFLSASGISTSPNGTLSQKIHCQEMP